MQYKSMLCNACHIYLKYVEQNKSKDIFFHHYYNNTVKIIIVIYNFKSLPSQFYIVSQNNSLSSTTNQGTNNGPFHNWLLHLAVPFLQYLRMDKSYC